LNCQTQDKDIEHSFTRLRNLTDNYRSSEKLPKSVHELYACLKSLENDTKEHTRKEEEVLFPMAIEREKELMIDN
jgi:iron-sulfur cluster repair protein YtfE (RIC family)